MGLILLIIIILLLVGGLPTWGHSRNWGYGPSGVLGLILVVLLVLIVMGQIPRGFSRDTDRSDAPHLVEAIWTLAGLCTKGGTDPRPVVVRKPAWFESRLALLVGGQSPFLCRSGRLATSRSLEFRRICRPLLQDGLHLRQQLREVHRLRVIVGAAGLQGALLVSRERMSR